MTHVLPVSFPLADVDPKRVAANVAVIAVHAVVFALLMLPSRWEPAAAPAPRTTTTIEIEPVRPPPIPPTPAPPELQPVRPTPVPVDPPPVVVPDVPPVDLAPLFETGEIAAEPVADVGPPPTTFEGGPQLATLAYLANPAPRYPRLSLRAGDEGRVLLRVLVDASGRPVEVTVERSSGHRDLDRAAREKVLADWRFHPAQRDGVPVSAYALVPIDFALP